MLVLNPQAAKPLDISAKPHGLPVSHCTRANETQLALTFMLPFPHPPPLPCAYAHARSHALTRLPVHLPSQHAVTDEMVETFMAVRTMRF